LEDDFPTLDASQKDSDPAKIEYLVKNTFIDGLSDYPALRSRSLEEFLLERHTKSCPTSHFNSGISQRLESLEEEPVLEEEPYAAPDKMLEFPKTPSPRCRGTHFEHLESLEEEEYESPPEDEPMVQFLPPYMHSTPVMPGSAFQAHQSFTQQRKNEPSAMYMDYSDRSTVAPSDGDPCIYDSPQFPMERPDVQAMGNSCLYEGVGLNESGPVFEGYESLPVPMDRPDGQAMQQEIVGERSVVVELSSILNNWSVGSTGHHFGRCKPCAFFWKDGCKDGQACQFCHTCPGDEKKKRTKQKMAWRRAVKVTRNNLRFGLF